MHLLLALRGLVHVAANLEKALPGASTRPRLVEDQVPWEHDEAEVRRELVEVDEVAHDAGFLPPGLFNLPLRNDPGREAADAHAAMPRRLATVVFAHDSGLQ